MGTPVADKLNQKDWLNCYAETRPWGYREQAPILNLTYNASPFFEINTYSRVYQWQRGMSRTCKARFLIF